jgi:hypothetical protein
VVVMVAPQYVLSSLIRLVPAAPSVLRSSSSSRRRCVTMLHNLPAGPPFMGPPHLSPSPDPPSSESKLPTSLWKGEGRRRHHCRGRDGGISGRAHIPQKRGGAPGRPIPSGWRRLEVVRERWWWRRNDRRRTKINHDVVDGGFKLRSPLKIALDISAHYFDIEIKTFIIL